MDVSELNKLYSLREKVKAQYAMADRMSSLSYENYLKYVVINSAPDPQLFKERAEAWQWDQARTIGPAIESITRIRKGYRGKRAFFRTMPRGHDKSSSIGRLMNWALGYTTKYFSAVVAAADREQAGLLLEFMNIEAELNPWLKKRLDFRQNRVVGRYGSNLKVLAADAYGSFGLNNDIIICDELTHWANEKLWNTLISGSGKRPGMVTIIITNAGMKGSWQWTVRERARTSPTWQLYEAPGPMASWMNTEEARENLKMLPPSEYRRCIRNEWLDPAEDCGYVSRVEAEYCELLGRDMGLFRTERGIDGREYFAGVDYGPKKDRTVLTLGHRVNNTFVVDQMSVLEGKDFPDKRVPVTLVEEWIDKNRKVYPNCVFVVDPYQMEGTIQALQGVANIERFEPRAGKANYELAQILRSAIVNGRLGWYTGCGEIFAPDDLGIIRLHTLVDEFADLIIKPTAAGYRLDHLPGKHDDRVVSLGMAVWRALSKERRRNLPLSEKYF